MLWGVALGTPFFLVFGWLSDKIGRKVIILAGCLIAAVTYIPIYQVIYVTMVNGPIAAFLVDRGRRDAVPVLPIEADARAGGFPALPGLQPDHSR